jgi:hypothetical protein
MNKRILMAATACVMAGAWMGSGATPSPGDVNAPATTQPAPPNCPQGLPHGPGDFGNSQRGPTTQPGGPGRPLRPKDNDPRNCIFLSGLIAKR